MPKKVITPAVLEKAQGVTIPLDVAVLVCNVFLPRNEFKMRHAAPETVKAVTEFKRCVTAQLKHLDKK